MSCNCNNNPLILPVGATGPQGPKGDPGFGFEHYIGEEFGGGVVFHVYKDADDTEHGLVVSIVDQSINSVWSNIDNLTANTFTWDGQTNTNLMAAQSGANTGAWKFANDYSYNSFTDWYLPSIDELNLLFTNRFNINKTLSTIGSATEIGYEHYWSSSELDNAIGWTFDFSLGFCDTGTKSSTFFVRAIRKF